MAAEKLRDLSQPIDVALLDATVAAFYGAGSKDERAAADQILRELQNNPDMWLQVVRILQGAQNFNTKFFALQASEFCNQFYRMYFLTIEQEIFAVLTDTFHKPGLKLHVLVLQHLFCLVQSDGLTEPLWDAATVSYPYPNNEIFVREYTIRLSSSSFPNMTAIEDA